MEFPHWHSEEE